MSHIPHLWIRVGKPPHIPDRLGIAPHFCQLTTVSRVFIHNSYSNLWANSRIPHKLSTSHKVVCGLRWVGEHHLSTSKSRTRSVNTPTLVYRLGWWFWVESGLGSVLIPIGANPGSCFWVGFRFSYSEPPNWRRPRLGLGVVCSSPR